MCSQTRVLVFGTPTLDGVRSLECVIFTELSGVDNGSKVLDRCNSRRGLNNSQLLAWTLSLGVGPEPTSSPSAKVSPSESAFVVRTQSAFVPSSRPSPSLSADGGSVPPVLSSPSAIPSPSGSAFVSHYPQQLHHRRTTHHRHCLNQVSANLSTLPKAHHHRRHHHRHHPVHLHRDQPICIGDIRTVIPVVTKSVTITIDGFAGIIWEQIRWSRSHHHRNPNAPPGLLGRHLQYPDGHHHQVRDNLHLSRIDIAV